MFEVGRLVARLTLEGAQSVGRELRAVASEWKNLSDEGQQAARTVGTTMVGAGASLIAMLGLATKAAIDWESAWAGVTKTVEGSPEQLAAVEAGLRGLAKSLPASHTEIAAVAEAAGQLGVQTENVVGFTRTMIDLGETTNLSADQAATALARFMNVMGTSQSEVSNLGSAVVELGNNYATTEAEIVEMAQRLSGAGRQIGLTEGEVLGLATSLSSVGIEAEAGGSAISKVMIDIASSVDKGGDRVALFAKTAGLSADEFSQKWKTAPGEALAAFVTGLANVEQQGGSTFGVLEELGITEVRMRDALLRSAAAADQFAGAMDQGNQAFEENTALMSEAEKRYATVESQIQMTANAVNDAAIDFGQVFMPAVSAAAGVVRDIAGFLGDLPPEIQGAIGTLGLLTGAVLLFGGTMLLTIPKIAEFRAATALLATEMPRTTAALRGAAGFLTGPWGLALAAAAVGVAVLQHQIDSMRASTAEWQNTLKNASSSSDLFATWGEGVLYNRLNEATREAEVFQQKLDLIANNDFARGFDLSATQLKSALKDIGGELATLAGSDLAGAQNGFRLLAEEMKLSKDQQLELLEAMPAYRDALIEQAAQQGVNVTTGTEAANAANLLTLAMGENETASQRNAAAYVEQSNQATALRDELQGLIDSMLELNGVGISAEEAQIRYQDQLRAVAEQIANVQAGTEGYAGGINIATEAGAANRQMLIDQAAASQAAAEKTFALDNDTAALSARLAEGRQQLINNAIQLGATAAEAEELANKIYGIPSEKEIQILADTSQARADTESYINSVTGRTVYVRIAGIPVAQGPGGSGGITQADGGIVHFAGGGIRENHIAQFARAGEWRVWAEPETGGEAYIPLAQSKRPRSLDVLGAVANEFGYDLTPRGTRGGAGAATVATAGGRGNEVVQETTILNLDGREVWRSQRQYERSIR